MKNIIKTFSLLAIFAIIPGAFAANATRVSLRGQPSTRGSSLSIAGKIRAIAANTTYGTATTTQWLSSAECVENYTGCLKDSAVCGEDLEECTNTVLLHAKMPSCLNVLMQCRDTDVANLFGSGAAISNLYNVPADGGKNAAGEVIKYTYPTNISILGQMIESAAITNRFSASQCVKKYTSCLNKDSVCGEDFELCTSKKEFKKNALMCESTLARCQSDGKTELFGGLKEADSLLPADKSRLNDMIKAGAQLAATNTLATCNKVADQCILKACSTNPTQCTVGISNAAKSASVDLLLKELGKEGADSKLIGTIQSNVDSLAVSSKKEVKDFIRGVCLETIGMNKYCYIVYKALEDANDSVTKKIKSSNVASILGDENFKIGEEDAHEVFSGIYENRMNDTTKRKIQDLADAFDTKAKNACSDVITECAMMSCGGGLGSLCYKKVFLNNGKDYSSSNNFKLTETGVSKIFTNSINKSETRDEIKRSCEAVVNTNPNCVYADAVLAGDQYNYSYIDSGAFNVLFPTDDTDPIGVVGRLNAALATSYNEAAIEKMRKDCANTAMACVKSVCGTDYVNCYRNRTDVRLSGTGSYADSVKSSSFGFAKSMDKVGGVLDYNIVTGLCMNTVKNAKSCEEHLKIAAAEFRDADMQDSTSWKDGNGQYSSVREAWLDSNKTESKFTNNKIVSGCTAKTNVLDSSKSCGTTIEDCGTTDDDGCYYDQPVYVDTADYVLEKSATSLFQQVLMDVERQVQMTYNAKLTREQNMCTQRNEGGVRGKNDTGSTYMWVKLRKSKVPANYSVTGLKANDFSATGDLYGAFCRVRVNLISDDKFIQEALSKEGASTEAYFAVGDTFTCGSWLSQKTIDGITNAVREHALGLEKGFNDDGTAKTGYTKKDAAALAWSTVGSFLVGGIGSYFGMDAAQRKGNSLGGLLGHYINTKRTGENQGYAETCINKAREAQKLKMNYDTDNGTEEDWRKAVEAANTAVTYAKMAGVNNITLEYKIKEVIASGRKFEKALPVKNENGSPARYAKTEMVPSGVDENGNITYVERPIVNQVVVSNLRQGDASAFGYDNMAKVCEWKNEDDMNNLVLSLKTSSDNTCKDAGAFIEARMKKKVPEKAVSLENYATCTILGDVKSIEVNCTNQLVTAVNKENFVSTGAYTNFSSALTELENECMIVKAGDRYDYANNPKKYLLNNMMAGLAGSAVTTALGAGIAKTVIDIKYENIQDEAVKKWMEEIGSHIQCVIGTEEAGDLGSTVTIDYED